MLFPGDLSQFLFLFPPHELWCKVPLLDAGGKDNDLNDVTFKGQVVRHAYVWPLTVMTPSLG